MSPIRHRLVQALAQRLGETDPAALAQLDRICECMPPERIVALMQRTEEIERNGGMLTDNKRRRRTKGGVFFRLALMRKTGKLTKAQRRYCFPALQRPATDEAPDGE
ncbi:MAG: hypothetical protein GFH27_549279n23 [Chloroflexi bacterium AL-W]|nr:hypothetical protein [Chloroflexi bacterium AL-N1]NOK71032.1 hypothetical protein [Chloroflexi bacterium AL-N10]NOK72745.1 hypothetical protein [Chloroflexi bacterium AL-N5]NOK79168.1 hypothetical protein [Chloroflexi bacterium AL-W]NOK87082.1 hypothetical protein [Chloroflexi bacterium AL-N15]